MIRINDSYLTHAIDYASYASKIAEINQSIDQKTGKGSDFLGWANYPETYDKEEFARIQKDGKYIHDHYDCLVVCGIGGSKPQQIINKI